MSMTKICKTCQIEQPIDNFSPKITMGVNKKKYSTHCSMCKPCNRAYMRNYRKTIVGKAETKLSGRKKRLKHLYGLSLEAYKTLMDSQDNKCAICYTLINESNKAIDHNHTTNKVRGVLCRLCNQAIGMFHESPAIMLSAIAYLSKEKYNG